MPRLAGPRSTNPGTPFERSPRPQNQRRIGFRPKISTCGLPCFHAGCRPLWPPANVYLHLLLDWWKKRIVWVWSYLDSNVVRSSKSAYGSRLRSLCDVVQLKLSAVAKKSAIFCFVFFFFWKCRWRKKQRNHNVGGPTDAAHRPVAQKEGPDTVHCTRAVRTRMRRWVISRQHQSHGRSWKPCSQMWCSILLAFPRAILHGKKQNQKKG